MLRSPDTYIGGLVLVMGTVALAGEIGWFQLGGSASVGSEALLLRIVLGLLFLWACLRADAVSAFFRRGQADPQPVQDQRITRGILGILLTVGFLLRSVDLGVPGLSWDEAMYAWLGASATLSDLWHNHSTRSPHPPGYFVTLHGILTWSWEPHWLRWPSVLAGTALIWASFAWARTLAGASSGLFMAVFVTFAPMLVELSRVARNYALGLLLGTLAAILFLRFLRTERWRDAAAFSVLSAASLFVHYSAAFVLAAQGVQFAAVGLLRRRGLAWWVRLTLCSLPAVAVAALLYFTHLSRLDPKVQWMHQWLYQSYMQESWYHWMTPVSDVWRYLAPLNFATFALLGFGAGMALLLVRRRRVEFFACALPLVVAYAMSWSGHYPLHGSRHSAYLFAFLFGPLAVLGAEVATAGHGLRRDDRSASVRSPEGEGSSRNRWFGRAGIVLAALLAGFYLDLSMEEYRLGPAADAQGGRVAEFLKDYRMADIETAFSLLDQRAEPNDVVLLTEQGMYTFRHHHRLRPVVPRGTDVDPEDEFLVGTVPKTVASRTQAGVRYYFTPRVGALFKWVNVEKLLEAYEEIRSKYDLKGNGSLWVLRGGWDPSISEAFRRQLPGTPVDTTVTEATGDVLFRVDGRVLANALAYRKMILQRSKANSPAAAPQP